MSLTIRKAALRHMQARMHGNAGAEIAQKAIVASIFVFHDAT